MNAPLDHSQVEERQFDASYRRANQWRSECIQQFARIELSITDALLALAGRPGLKVKLTGQIRQSFDELNRLTGAKNLKIDSIAKSLERIGPLIGWRAHLTHGVMSVWRGKGGQWLFTLEHREVAGGLVQTHAMTERDAEALLRRLTEEAETLQKRVHSMQCRLEGQDR